MIEHDRQERIVGWNQREIERAELIIRFSEDGWSDNVKKALYLGAKLIGINNVTTEKVINDFPYTGISNNNMDWSIYGNISNGILYLGNVLNKGNYGGEFFTTLAGMMLAEAIRKILPLDIWKYEPKPIICFPETRYAPTNTKKEVVLVGAGALGNWFIHTIQKGDYGIQKLTIIDNDEVDITNLNRQCMFTENDIGEPKAKILAERLLSSCSFPISYKVEKVKDENIDGWFSIFPYQKVIVCGVDNWRTRSLLNKIAVNKKITLINAGSDPTSANAYIYRPNETPCLNCAINVDTKASVEVDKYSCADVDPSVVTTNMIGGGLLAWLLKNQGCNNEIMYDISMRERIGLMDYPVRRKDCKC